MGRERFARTPMPCSAKRGTCAGMTFSEVWFSGDSRKQSGCYGLVCSRQAKSKHQWLGQMMRTDPGQLLTTHGEFVKRGDPAWRLWRRKTGRKAFTGCALCYYRRGMKVTIENKKEVKVRGQELHPLNKGKPCPKGASGEVHKARPSCSISTSLSFSWGTRTSTTRTASSAA